MKSINHIASIVLLGTIAIAFQACNKKSTPTPVPSVTIDASLLLGPVWNTTTVVATKPDGTTVTITTGFTALFLAEPRFDTLPSGTTLGTGNEKLFGANFVYSYDTSNHVLTVPFDASDVEIATITKLDAHTLVLHHEGNTLDYGSTYTKFDQTLTR
ncbi:MAG: hypothetical protein JWP94_2951 [Mucilaginibacter sp.]|nr:hypothetical protein [Mucilaginibacter sp.]